MTGLAALAMGGCPQTGPGNGNGNDPPPGQDLTVDVTYEGEGTVTQEADGNMVTLTAVPSDGWIFDGWSGAVLEDQEKNLNPLPVDATQVESITANFIEDTEPPRPVNTCGDGVQDRTEQCDDGNTVDGDGCSSTCQIETPTPSRCGDGVLDAGEQCDGGNETQTCNANCTNTRCGDGIVNLHAGEQCDDRNTVNEDGCSSICHNETPPPPGCDDGVVNGTEQCDGGGSETATCNINCTTSRCGDAIVNSHAGEQCDDGNTVNGDGCSLTCQIETGGGGGGGGGGGTTPVCGNGTIETGEQCDDGNTANGDGCSSTCQSEPGGPLCGNGVVEGTEQCDDGNTNAGDGCSATCRNEPGGIPNDLCSAPIAVGDGTLTYSNVGATTDGPDEPAMCNFFGRTNVYADIWYCYTATCTGTAMASLCGSDYDTKLAVYSGCDCPTSPPLACSDDDCGTGVENVQSRVTFAATAGQSYMVRVGGYLGEQGNVKLTIGCNVDACANGTGSCIEAKVAPGCDDADDCCTKTCAVDQFCCDVTWDATCAGEASGICTGSFPTCSAGAGACGVSDNTPGCDNATCCNKVCSVDPFCCLEEWDATCVNEAESMCTLTCGPGAGDCHSVHATPGCNSQTCCDAICADDPFCCDTEWDQTCVTAASTSCP
jgi:cysteine-rich repeat protein